uniref:hypothetical protein n=1 Tax=Gracilaria bursa-pastoris TaxID=172962 RepID=UPI001D1246AB|nr:hypothetical protein LK221_pgp002 [Gracilaria bursa-pastoris]UAD83450.1 hypothetical protein [Gracilaria bursa-pastoris]
MIGSSLDLDNNSVHSSISCSKSYKSVSKSNIIKVCNVFNIFCLASYKPLFSHLVLNCSSSPDNYLKLCLHQGSLNHFDLTVFLAILH